MIESLLGRRNICLLALPYLQGRLLDGAGAIASAMLRVTDSGNEVLWSSGVAA